ncbi:uroporphyrinogen-III synthase [Microaerobacter geothermalis]|uniref:uroporphyrinogen-III synthase n=1 Tax=Microaerobacter geothermalis TaxID=674972 RepID=UPI001F34BE35|nr:uroporphyrinogen-III synthase [Microaerobacter geothermalis]MCF6092669.1 uroporphyrinogen-III synthase [Microaerobacter geothermalis]
MRNRDLFPLTGKKILITRAKAQTDGVSAKIRELGGEPAVFPLIQVIPPKDTVALDLAIYHLEQFDWVIFTSVNGVRFFLNRLEKLSFDIQVLSRINIAAVGPKTADVLRKNKLEVHWVPTTYQAEGFLQEMEDYLKPGQKVLLPRANIARKLLPEELRRRGVQVTEVDVYETVIADSLKDELVDLLKKKQVHIITFASSSAVQNFCTILEEEKLEELISGIKIVCIGPITANTAKELSLPVDAVAKPSTMEGLLDAIKNI